MPRRKSDAFDIRLTDAKRDDLANELCQEIEDALNARTSVIGPEGMIDLLDWFYEQGRTPPQDRPFPGAADLTSWFILEGVDAMRARAVKSVLRAEPFCTVDGWGQSSTRAPIVEAFHDWQIREEKLLGELSKVIHGALIEDCYVLEVRPRVETKLVVEEIDAAIEVNEQGGPVIGPDGNPVLIMDGDEPVEAQSGAPSARVKRTYTRTRQLGPEYDAISMKDFVFLPGHAKNRRAVWGYAYRFWSRYPEVLEKAKDGIYDLKTVEKMGDQSDRSDSISPKTVDGIAAQNGPAQEKELFQLSLKRDLDKDGHEEWYLVTLSLKERAILRLKLDTFVMKVGKPRCVPFVLYPRRDSVYGYSYAEKLLTLAEEHTSLRNMKADRSALATNAPIMQLTGGKWDPNVQPLGVGRVITIGERGELEPMKIADVPNSIIEQERGLIGAAERVRGLSDMGAGVQANQQRTLGENQMVQSGSAIRVDEPIDNLREAIIDVMDLRQAIWLETLEANGAGLEAPADVAESLEARGVAEFEGRFTADILKGKFKFKPYGSVDTADVGRRIQYFTEGTVALKNLSDIMPAIKGIFASAEVQKAILSEWARAYKVGNVNVFLKALLTVLQAPAPMMPQAGGMDAAGGMPPQQGAMPVPAPAGGSPEDMIRAIIAQGGNAQ